MRLLFLLCLLLIPAVAAQGESTDPGNDTAGPDVEEDDRLVSVALSIGAIVALVGIVIYVARRR